MGNDNHHGPQVIVAKEAGTCFGVERALRMAFEAAAAPGTARTLGPLIHNPRVVADLEKQGIGMASSLDEFEEGQTIVIRSHGVEPKVLEEARERGLGIVDTTCPFVKKAHDAARLLSDEGYQVLIIGEPGHAEVEGILGHAGPDAVVIDSPERLEGIMLRKRVGVVVQTTQSQELLQEVVDRLLARASEVRVFPTICLATRRRQEAATELAKDVEAMVVVGGRNSGNTRRLAQICAAINPRTYHIEGEDELDPSWFEGCTKIGLTAGASTPQSHIEAVLEAIGRLTETK